MSTINEIYRINYMRNSFSYVGTLRNEYKFNISEDVFFVINTNEIAKGIIVGVELPPIDNPEYKYKIRLPEEIIKKRLGDDFWKNQPDFDKITLKCDRIFRTITDAKISAIEQTDRMYKLQKEEIERYFKRFE